MDLSVIIVNYNVREFLATTLQSVQKALTGIAGEVFVVDNRSQDDSVAMVRARFPDVHLLALDENVGFARANNLAMHRARGRYVLILNPDTLLQEDTLREMIAFMDAHPDAGMAGCKLLNADGMFQLSCRRGFPTPWASFSKVFGLSTLFPAAPLFAGYNLTYLDEDGEYPVDALSGAFMMVRRELIDAIGGFDEDYFMYGEDLDWCYRARMRGWKVYYTARTRIVHYKGESTKRSSLDDVRVFYDAMRIFVRKNFSAPWLFIAFLRAGIAMRAFLAVLSRRRAAVALACFDAAAVVLALLGGTWQRFHSPFAFRSSAYPGVVLVPVLVTMGMLWLAGAYGRTRHAASRAALGVLGAFFVISSLTYFFKDYAFSRQIVLEMSIVDAVLLVAARLALQARGELRRHGLLRRTVIVGTDEGAVQVLQRLRSAGGTTYDVVGFIGATVDQIGHRVADVPVLGSLQTIGRALREHDVRDVIFVSDSIPYAEILAAMQRCAGQAVTFRLVPARADVVLAKSGVDLLDAYPLVAFAYNIHKPLNQTVKRLLDLSLALPALVLVLVAAPLLPAARRRVRALWAVARGAMTFVGPRTPDATAGGLGKRGAVSMAEAFVPGPLSAEQRTQFDEYYARHQSILLDLKVLARVLRNAARRSSPGT